MGVHKRATNLAVNGDFGRTPYFIDIICSILKQSEIKLDHTTPIL